MLPGADPCVHGTRSVENQRTRAAGRASRVRLPPLALGKEASRTETVSGKEAAVLDLGTETVVMSHAKLELLIHELRRAQESLQNCL